MTKTLTESELGHCNWKQNFKIGVHVHLERDAKSQTDFNFQVASYNKQTMKLS